MADGRVQVVGLAQPLLDISVTVDTGVMDSLRVEEDSAVRGEGEVGRRLAGVRGLGQEHSAGGATSNSLRVAARLLGRGGQVACLGTVRSFLGSSSPAPAHWFWVQFGPIW